MNIAFFGSSLVSSYWNGAATYYRGIVRALAARGHRIAFYEPDAYDRHRHRDIDDPPWATVVVYEPQDWERTFALAANADVVVKASGVGVCDDELEAAVAELDRATTIFWDVDAPATLARVEADEADPFRALLPRYDFVLTYGGGEPVVERYLALGARECMPVYNALDPMSHRPVAPDPRFASDLAFLGNRLPDREARVHEFFLRAAELLPRRSFLLAGAGWQDAQLPPNVRVLGHIGTGDHNAFNSSPLAVLNVTRESMATNGWSPPTRVFEVAGAAGCLITDAWQGIEMFLEPEHEVLVAANGSDVAAALDELTPNRARRIGEAARNRILGEHTYERRAEQVDELLAVHV